MHEHYNKREHTSKLARHGVSNRLTGSRYSSALILVCVVLFVDICLCFDWRPALSRTKIGPQSQFKTKLVMISQIMNV